MLRRHEKVEHMERLRDVRRDVRKQNVVTRGPFAKRLVITRPDPLPSSLNLRPTFELRKQEGGEDVRGQVARPDVHPSVFVDLASKESASIGSFLAHDLCTVDEVVAIEKNSTALAAREVFCLMETQGRHIAEGSKH